MILPVSRGWFNEVYPWERSRSTATGARWEQGGVEHIAQNLLKADYNQRKVKMEKVWSTARLKIELHQYRFQHWHYTKIYIREKYQYRCHCCQAEKGNP